MSSPRFNSVEEYLAALDPAKARTLRSVIDLILTEFPELESKISWNVPQIHRNGKYVFGVCAFKHHLTLAPWSTRVIEAFKARLGKFVVKKNCFQIPVDWKVDRKLLKDLVRARLAELTVSKKTIDQRNRDKGRGGDWRGQTLAHMRALILEAVPEMIEERKWRKPSNAMAGVPVWSHQGIVCTGETYKKVVKLTFAHGASLPDPSGLFNSSLEGNTRRAIDIHEGQQVDAGAFKALVKAAVARNGPPGKKR